MIADSSTYSQNDDNEERLTNNSLSLPVANPVSYEPQKCNEMLCDLKKKFPCPSKKQSYNRHVLELLKECSFTHTKKCTEQPSIDLYPYCNSNIDIKQNKIHNMSCDN